LGAKGVPGDACPHGKERGGRDTPGRSPARGKKEKKKNRNEVAAKSLSMTAPPRPGDS